jgi:hypothetical protein
MCDATRGSTLGGMRSFPHRFALPVLICLGALGARDRANWLWGNPLPQGHDLYAVHFSDAARGIAVGDAGTLLSTGDSGRTWQIAAAGAGTALAALHFTASDTGYAAGFGKDLDALPYRHDREPGGNPFSGRGPRLRRRRWRGAPDPGRRKGLG